MAAWRLRICANSTALLGAVLPAVPANPPPKRTALLLLSLLCMQASPLSKIKETAPRHLILAGCRPHKLSQPLFNPGKCS